MGQGCFRDSRRCHLHRREQVKFDPTPPWPGHQFPAEPFSFWLKAPARRPIRRGGGGDRRSLRLADGSGAVESGQKSAATAGRVQ